MLRTINNYSFIDNHGAMINPRGKQKKFYLYGQYTDSWSFFVETEACLTASVTSVTDELVSTEDGKHYQLGTISKDYRDFLIATQNGIEAISNWNIYGSKKRGYYLLGDNFLAKKAIPTSKIISQERNFLIIKKMARTPSGENIWSDPERIFVCWSSPSKNALIQIKQNGRLADIKYSDFERFNGIICRPALFKVD